MYENALVIANYFLSKGMQSGIPITPMKLQKLVYIAHGWNLGVNNRPLIQENVYAWKFGPVIKEIYDEFREFGGSPITRFAYNHPPASSSDYTNQFLDLIWNKYGKKPGYALSALTHEPNTPWETRYKEGVNNIVIPQDVIKEHYKELAAKKGFFRVDQASLGVADNNK